ncbi:hypothetical protein QN326_04570 [Candidatus Phytoplasma asteris]|uniref:Uncharacterized protein n=1 Tax=Candidatus Phytoplasma asteris TaxID=85620 RepID=A0ABZ3CF26_9MOLU
MQKSINLKNKWQLFFAVLKVFVCIFFVKVKINYFSNKHFCLYFKDL